MKMLKNLAITFLTIALLNGIHVILQSYSESYTHLLVKSEDGAQIYQKKHGHQYGTPIDGSYLISLPTGKYMSASNIREGLIIQGIFLAAGLGCMIAFLQSEYRFRQRNEGVKES